MLIAVFFYASAIFFKKLIAINRWYTCKYIPLTLIKSHFPKSLFLKMNTSPPCSYKRLTLHYRATFLQQIYKRTKTIKNRSPLQPIKKAPPINAGLSINREITIDTFYYFPKLPNNCIIHI